MQGTSQGCAPARAQLVGNTLVQLLPLIVTAGTHAHRKHPTLPAPAPSHGPTCVASIEATQIHLAVSTPKATGRDWRPMARSPAARRGAGARGRCGGRHLPLSAPLSLIPLSPKPPHPHSNHRHHRHHRNHRTLDGLEVVHDCDAQAGDGVEHREHHDVGGEGAKQRLHRGARRGRQGRRGSDRGAIGSRWVRGWISARK